MAEYLSERYVRAMMEFVMHAVMHVMSKLFAVQICNMRRLRPKSILMEAHHDLDILGHTRYALSRSSRLVIRARQAQQPMGLPNWKRPFFMELSA